MTTGDDKTKVTEFDKGSLLIVDDNPTNLEVLSVMLLDRGYEIKAAVNGRRALAQVQASHPDLVLLDINMPGMDGYEVCRQLKSDPATRSIPIIFISALSETLDKVKAFQAGGVDYVSKPFQVEEVIARIESQLKISRLQKDLERKNAQLERKNDELTRANRRADLIFSMLSDVLPGMVLEGKYRLERKIGAGGFGSVYEATHLNLNRVVAVKTFQPPQGSDSLAELERFRREGISACRVNHPNAITILDSGVTREGIAYLVMERLDGRTLQKELIEKGRLSPARCCEILQPVCDVLTAAHKAGIVHRDIKPENIFLHRTKEGEVVKVVDFGIAKLLGEAVESGDQLTLKGVIGTPVYMSPERLGKKTYDGKSDIYSVGVMLYRMLTGRLPFQDEDVLVVALQHLSEPPPPLRRFNPNISETIEQVVLRVLDKDPERRPSPGEFADQFRAALDSTGFASISDAERCGGEIDETAATLVSNLPEPTLGGGE